MVVSIHIPELALDKHRAVLETHGHYESTLFIIRALLVKPKITVSKINLDSELKCAETEYSP